MASSKWLPNFYIPTTNKSDHTLDFHMTCGFYLKNNKEKLNTLNNIEIIPFNAIDRF